MEREKKEFKPPKLFLKRKDKPLFKTSLTYERTHVFLPQFFPNTQFLKFKLYGFLKIYPPSNTVNYNSYFSHRNVCFLFFVFLVVFSACKCSKNVLLELFLKTHGLLDNNYCRSVPGSIGDNIFDRLIGMRIPFETLINFI